MANRERGEVELAFGGERYTLRMSLNAVAEVETYLDMGVNDIAALVGNPKNFRIGTWRVLLWGALREFHPCSIEEAGEIMQRAGVDAIMDKVVEAMQLSHPEKQAGAKNPRKASRKVGSTT
jgi:hypothetical protein